MSMMWIEPWVEPLVQYAYANKLEAEEILRALQSGRLRRVRRELAAVKSGLEAIGYSQEHISEIVSDLRKRALSSAKPGSGE